MNNESTFKQPAQFVKGGANPPKSPQGKPRENPNPKTQMAKKTKKKHMKHKHEKKEEKHKMCAKCKEDHKTSEHKEKHMKKKSGHKPVGAHGRAAVHALGRTKTTGNFKKIEESKGKGAAIGAYQNALKAHQAKKRKAAEKKMTGKELLGKAMKRLKH